MLDEPMYASADVYFITKPTGYYLKIYSSNFKFKIDFYLAFSQRKAQRSYVRTLYQEPYLKFLLLKM